MVGLGAGNLAPKQLQHLIPPQLLLDRLVGCLLTCVLMCFMSRFLLSLVNAVQGRNTLLIEVVMADKLICSLEVAHSLLVVELWHVGCRLRIPTATTRRLALCDKISGLRD